MLCFLYFFLYFWYILEYWVSRLRLAILVRGVSERASWEPFFILLEIFWMFESHMSHIEMLKKRCRNGVGPWLPELQVEGWSIAETQRMRVHRWLFAMHITIASVGNILFLRGIWKWRVMIFAWMCFLDCLPRLCLDWSVSIRGGTALSLTVLSFKIRHKDQNHFRGSSSKRGTNGVLKISTLLAISQPEWKIPPSSSTTPPRSNGSDYKQLLLKKKAGHGEIEGDLLVQQQIIQKQRCHTYRTRGRINPYMSSSCYIE